ncbi:MAG: hypothetical protein L0241_00835 [Planctomycetia bacterium]|nr:hypothetical protein [Planctomycetia bacterium]
MRQFGEVTAEQRSRHSLGAVPVDVLGALFGYLIKSLPRLHRDGPEGPTGGHHLRHGLAGRHNFCSAPPATA